MLLLFWLINWLIRVIFWDVVMVFGDVFVCVMIFSMLGSCMLDLVLVLLVRVKDSLSMSFWSLGLNSVEKFFCSRWDW